MKKPTPSPDYWDELKKLRDVTQSYRAGRSDASMLALGQIRANFIKIFSPRNKARFQQDFDDLFWDLVDDERMFSWFTRRGGHYDYIRQQQNIETPSEIYCAYCRRYKIDIPLAGQQQLF